MVADRPVHARTRHDGQASALAHALDPRRRALRAAHWLCLGASAARVPAAGHGPPMVPAPRPCRHVRAHDTCADDGRPRALGAQGAKGREASPTAAVMDAQAARSGRALGHSGRGGAERLRSGPARGQAQAARAGGHGRAPAAGRLLASRRRARHACTTATAGSPCSRHRASPGRSWRVASLTVPTPGRGSRLPRPSPSRSSAARQVSAASPSNPEDGLSSAASPGLDAAAGSPATTKPRQAQRSPSSSWQTPWCSSGASPGRYETDTYDDVVEGCVERHGHDAERA